MWYVFWMFCDLHWPLEVTEVTKHPKMHCTKISLKILPGIQKSCLWISDSKIGQIWASLRPLKSNFEFCVNECLFGMPQAFKKCIILTSTLPSEITLWDSILANFHICQLLPGKLATYSAIQINTMDKMAESLTMHNPAQFLFPGKNRIRKIREKSGYQIFTILGQILRMDTINHWFME